MKKMLSTWMFAFAIVIGGMVIVTSTGCGTGVESTPQGAVEETDEEDESAGEEEFAEVEEGDGE